MRTLLSGKAQVPMLQLIHYTSDNTVVFILQHIHFEYGLSYYIKPGVLNSIMKQSQWG